MVELMQGQRVPGVYYFICILIDDIWNLDIELKLKYLSSSDINCLIAANIFDFNQVFITKLNMCVGLLLPPWCVVTFRDSSYLWWSWWRWLLYSTVHTSQSKFLAHFVSLEAKKVPDADGVMFKAETMK